MSEKELIEEIVAYFETRLFKNHVEASLKNNARLKSYHINPILVKYLSKILVGDYTANGVAKALFYPRVLGTSINTSFGTRIQNMFVELDLARGSLIKGMDIEFIDKVDGRKKWCQLKSGPNTINSEDVKPLLNKFTNTINLARTNRAFKDVNNTDFIVGVLYGEVEELSLHYKMIDQIHPVIIGKELWYRITGFPEIYYGLVKELHNSILALDTKDLINKGCSELEEEIKNSPLFDF
jgi:hypothetical protein